MAADSAGHTWLALPQLNVVYRLDGSGVLTLVAGTGVAGYSGDSGAAVSAMLNRPQGVAVDAFGDVFIADSGNERIREVTPNGVITTVAGNGNCCYSGDGGPATSAWLNNPYAVVIDASGNLYIADTGNNRIREVSGGIITTVAGNGTSGYAGDSGSATSAELSSPDGVAVDSLGNLVHRRYQQRADSQGVGGTITTFAGTERCCYSGDNGTCHQRLSDEQSPGTGAGILPENLYIADSNNERIRKVSTSGTITTVAGNGDYPVAAGDVRTGRTCPIENTDTTGVADKPIGQSADRGPIQPKNT